MQVKGEWDDLRYALALARHRRLSAAARALGATHTTVARRVQALEANLGVRLFDAVGDGYTPTALGLHVVEAAERTEAELLALEALVLGGDARLAGPLRVSTMDLLFRRYQSVFTSFLTRYPAVELTVISTDQESSLIRREADIALRLSNQPPEQLVGRKIDRVEFAVYASRALVDRVGAEAPLSAYPWLHWDERLEARWLEGWLAEHAPGAKIALRIDLSTLAIREAISAGLGAHFYAVVEGDAEPGWVRLTEVQPNFTRDVWLLTLPGLRTSSRVRAFLDHFGEQLQV